MGNAPVALMRESHPSHDRRHDPPAYTLHHLSGFQVLLQQAVDLGNWPAASPGDSLSPASVQNIVMAAFLRGHGVDNSFDMSQLLLVDLEFVQSAHRSHVWQHPENLLEGTK